MRVLSFLIVFSLGLFVSAQEKVEKTVGEFSKLKVYDLIQIKMVKSNENKVVISGKNSHDVTVNNKNGKLKIKMKLKEIFDGNQTEVILYFTGVDVIDANEGAKITVEDPIEQYEIDFKTQEGGQIFAKVDATYANFRAVTGGVIDVSGYVKNQDISIYTGGVFNGEELITDDTEVSINAAGEAHINAKERAKVRIKAGGDVYIYGEPKLVDESKVFGGRIKRM